MSQGVKPLFNQICQTSGYYYYYYYCWFYYYKTNTNKFNTTHIHTYISDKKQTPMKAL